MPLFDAIEADVTAFLVSQGSVFDLLIKSVLDRVATVENRVQVLRTDVTANLQTIRQQLLSVSGGDHLRVNASSPVVDPEAIAEAAKLAALSAVASVSASTATDRQTADERSSTLARQLNTVLELVFCPHAPGEATVASIREKQSRLLGIADVLRDNERILSQLVDQSSADTTSTAAVSESGDDTGDVSDPSSGLSQVTSPDVADQDVEPVLSGAIDLVEGDDAPELTPIREERVTEATVDDRPREEDQTDEDRIVEPPSEASTSGFSGGDGREEQQSEWHASDQRQQKHQRGNRRERRDYHDSELPTRKKSVYHAYQDLQQLEEARLRELRLRDDALLEAMREMLKQSTSQTRPVEDDCQLRSMVHDLAADNARIRSETSELARELTEQSDHQHQAMDEALTLHNQQLDELQRQLERELESVHRQYEEQRKLQAKKAERDARLQPLEQQLQDATTQLVAMLEGHAQELADKIAALEARVQGQFMTKAELEGRQAAWQRTAASNCVFGATPATLAELQRGLDAIRAAKASPTTDGEEDATALDEAVDQLAQTTEDALEIARNVSERGSLSESEADEYLPLSSDALRVMKTLRVQLSRVNDLARHGHSSTEQHPDVASDSDDGRDLSLLATALQRMELGTASLLDGCDAQFTRYQEVLRSHQGAIGLLRQQLQQQTQSEMALRARLALCPSQEDTQRLLQALQDKIAEMTSDSASQTAATLSELRAKLTDLPTNELLQRLALDLRGKADRVEMDRLRSLLEAQGSAGLPGPAASLTKSPLRCLSCDQMLYNSMPPSPTSRPGSPSSPSRPLAKLHGCHNCGHVLAHPNASCGEDFLGSQDAGGIEGDCDRITRVWSSPAFCTNPGATAGVSVEPDSDDITEDLFAVAAAARQRRQREQQQARLRILATPQAQAKRAATAGARREFVNLDEGRNRIPLRRSVLADRIVYGPSIAPHALRKKLAVSVDPKDVRAVIGAERRAPGGQVIARASASSALVRPFAELERDDERLARQSPVPSPLLQSQRPQHRSDRGKR